MTTFETQTSYSKIPVCEECGSQRGLPKGICQTCIANGWVEIEISGAGGSMNKIA